MAPLNPRTQAHLTNGPPFTTGLKGHHDYPPSSRQEGEDMEGHPWEGFRSQTLMWHTAFPLTFHPLKLSHMAHELQEGL